MYFNSNYFIACKITNSFPCLIHVCVNEAAYPFGKEVIEFSPFFGHDLMFTKFITQWNTPSSAGN